MLIAIAIKLDNYIKIADVSFLYIDDIPFSMIYYECFPQKIPIPMEKSLLIILPNQFSLQINFQIREKFRQNYSNTITVLKKIKQ